MRIFKFIWLLTVVSAGIFAFASNSFCADLTKTIYPAGQWPFHLTKSVAVDTDSVPHRVFLGDGDRLVILDDQLNIIENIIVSKNADITSIYYSQEENRLYVTSRYDGLLIIDVPNGQEPLQHNLFQTVITDYEDQTYNVDAMGVYTQNHTAYIACGFYGIQVVDVTDPDHPSLKVQIGLQGAYGITYATDMISSGNYLYVADIYNGVDILDITELDTIELLAYISLPNARALTLSGNNLYVAAEGNYIDMATEKNGVAIYDVSDPNNLKNYIYESQGQDRSIALDGNTAYIGYSLEGIQVVDMSDLANPIHDPAWEYNQTGATSLALDPVEHALFVTDDVVGMQKIDVSDFADLNNLPGSPGLRLAKSFDTPSDATAIAISGNYAYVLDNNFGNDPGKEGLRILNMEVISNMAIKFNLTGFVATPGTANEIFVKEPYAYVADGDQGLQIIDVSDKAAPVIVGSFKLDGSSGLYVQGDSAYVANGGNGLAVIDIGTPASPALVRTVPTTASSNDVFVSGDYAYIADGGNGLTVFNINDPENSKISIPTSAGIASDAQGILVAGNLAYVANGSQGLSILDLTDPAQPVLKGTGDTAGYTKRVTASGVYAFVADGENGVAAFDISNPLLPAPVSGWSYNTSGNTTDIATFYGNEDAGGFFAMTADGPAGAFALFVQQNDGNDNSASEGGSSGCFIESLGCW